jgi:dTDP-4-amino-4,6-dideoxygalactose transaminase
VNVPLVDLKAQYARIAPDIDRAVAEVVRSQHFILGQPVKDLEQHLSTYLGTPHTIGVASGSDALLLALMALDIGPGDGVITTPFSFFATASSITRVGATPIFLDIDPHDYNLDPAAVQTYLASLKKTKTKAGTGFALKDSKRKVTVRAILPVHLYGQCARIDRLAAIAKDHGLKLVEDAAQAIGSFLDGRAAGTWGDIGCYSFYPSKNLGAAGDAGAMVTNDAKLNERLRVLRAHGSATTYVHGEVGINSRLDNIQAAVLDVKLKHLETWNDERRARAAHYVRLLEAAGLVARDAAGRKSGLLTVPPVDRARAHNFHQFVVRSTRREALVEQFKGRGIGHAVYYPVPLHKQPCYAKMPWASDSCPHAEAAAKETLALPMYAELSAQQQTAVVEAMAEVVRPRVAVARA